MKPGHLPGARRHRPRPRRRRQPSCRSSAASWTTYRLMAEQTADVVCTKLGVTAPSTTAGNVLPNQGDGRTYWLGHRLASTRRRRRRRESHLRVRDAHSPGGRAVPRRALAVQPRRTSDAGRGSGWARARAGSARSGPPGLVANEPHVGSWAGRRRRRSSGGWMGEIGSGARRLLAERFRGTPRPIAWGRQLQELWVTSRVVFGVLGSAVSWIGQGRRAEGAFHRR